MAASGSCEDTLTKMDRFTAFNAVRAAVVMWWELAHEKVNEETPIEDVMDLVVIVRDIEEVYGLAIPEEEAAAVGTLGQLTDLLVRISNR